MRREPCLSKSQYVLAELPCQLYVISAISVSVAHPVYLETLRYVLFVHLLDIYVKKF